MLCGESEGRDFDLRSQPERAMDEGSITRHPSRGRSHGRRRRKLPPIAESSLSGRRLGSVSNAGGRDHGGSGCGGSRGGDRERSNISSKMHQTTIRNARSTVPPSPESRKHASSSATGLDSRDDEDPPPVNSQKLMGINPEEENAAAAAVSAEMSALPYRRKPDEVAPNEHKAILPDPPVGSQEDAVYEGSSVGAMTTRDTHFVPGRSTIAPKGTISLATKSREAIHVHRPSMASRKASAFGQFDSVASIAGNGDSYNASKGVVPEPGRYTQPDSFETVNDIPSCTKTDKGNPHGDLSIRSTSKNTTVEVAKSMEPTPKVPAIGDTRLECDKVKRVERRVMPSWEEYQTARKETFAVRRGSGSNSSTSYDMPEITSIPTDEILDSCKEPKDPRDANTKESTAMDADAKGSHSKINYSDDSSELSDEMRRDTRDQYQLGRLKARINQRRVDKNHQVAYDEEDAPNYKTMRSSRIKTVRNLYSSSRGDSKVNYQQRTVGNGQEFLTPLRSEANASIHGSSITNASKGSSIPSLKHGQTICHSLTSSVSGNYSGGVRSRNDGGEDTSQELSEYRGKLFAKMLQLLNELSPTKEGIISEDTASEIREKIIDEGRASCCSIAELKLIQKLTEEEMSRILTEFELNNSLIEKKEEVIYNGIPDFNDNNSPDTEKSSGKEEEIDEGEDDMLHDLPPPQNIGMSAISTKLSDVTSPTCHEGFELDEIMPTMPQLYHHKHTNSSLPPRSPKSNAHNHHSIHGQKKRLPSSLSPAAAAAAETAASLSKSTATNGKERHSYQEPNPLPRVLELDIDLVRDDGDAAKKGTKSHKQQELFVVKDEVVEGRDDGDEEHIVNDISASPGPREAVACSHDTTLVADNDLDRQSNDANKAEKVLMEESAAMIVALSQERAQRTAQEDDFHDDILTAVAKASAAAETDENAEVNEVTSILSQYEEAEKKAKENLDKILKCDTESQQGGTADSLSMLSSPFDERIPTEKKVTFLEPLPVSDNPDMLCGCTIQ